MGAVSLVECPPGRCPICTRPLDHTRVEQPALLRHGGHGATRIEVHAHCPSCGWWLTREQSETRP